MRKFFILISAFLFLCGESFCGTVSSQPAHPFSQALSTNDINYIFLKRRDERGQMPPLSIKRIFCIFAMLDKMMRGNWLLEEKDRFWVDDDTEDEDLSEIYSSQETPDYMYEHLVSITNQIPQCGTKNYTLAVFSETFFSNNPALDNLSVTKIVECCRLLTKKHANLIICVNFLHKFTNASRPIWLQSLPSALHPEDYEFIGTDDMHKAKLLSTDNSNSELRFSNYSLIVWNEISLSCYRKTVYLSEQDSLIDMGYGFDFGNWNSYQNIELASASQEHRNFAKFFNIGDKQVVMTRICADLASMPDIPRTINLLIAQANSAPGLSSWYNKIHSIFSYCDADKGCCIIVPHQDPYVKTTKDAQKINTCPFVENDLHCTIYVYQGGRHD